MISTFVHSAATVQSLNGHHAPRSRRTPTATTTVIVIPFSSWSPSSGCLLPGSLARRFLLTTPTFAGIPRRLRVRRRIVVRRIRTVAVLAAAVVAVRVRVNVGPRLLTIIQEVTPEATPLELGETVLLRHVEQRRVDLDVVALLVVEETLDSIPMLFQPVCDQLAATRQSEEGYSKDQINNPVC